MKKYKAGYLSILIMAMASIAWAQLPPLGQVLSEERAWEQDDFDSVLAGIMLKHVDADVAIVEEVVKQAAVKGPIDLPTAIKHLNRPGRLATFVTSGKQIKAINSFNNKGIFKTHLKIYGVDKGARHLNGRTLNDQEKVKVVLSENALNELVSLLKFGVLSDEFVVRANFAEAIYGDLKSVNFIGGTKGVLVNDTPEAINSAEEQVKANKSIAAILEEELKGEVSHDLLRDYLMHPEGILGHALLFDISYLDIGFSKNVANSTYTSMLKNKELPMGRGGVPLYAHLFLFAKMGLTYDAPALETSLLGNVKFMQTNPSAKPEKDKLKLELNFRLPWERSVFKDEEVVISPIWLTSYETNIAPFNFLYKEPVTEWDDGGKKEDISPRKKQVDTLLGAEANFRDLGFRVQLGATAVANLNREILGDKFDVGPGLNFFSKWSIWGPFELSSEIKSYYLWPVTKSNVTDKIAFGLEGTAWLRIARIHDFSVSMMSDFLFATLQHKSNEMAISSIFGLTVSYGRLFRLFG